MTHQSCSSSLDEVVPGGSSCSSSTTSREVYSLPLGTNGDIYLNQEEQNLVALCGGLAAETNAQTLVVASPGTRVGNDVLVTVEGDAIFHVNSPDGPQKNAPASSQRPPTCERKPCSGIGLIRRHFKGLVIMISAVTLVCAVALIALRFVGTHDSNLIIPTTENPTTITKQPLVRYVIKRDFWGARSPNVTPIPIETPVSLVIIKHTKTQTCYDVPSCCSAMHELQNTDVGEYGLSDIRYNFVVGGDGNIYEGRGWKVQNEQMNNTIDIAFLGDFNVDVPNTFMTGAGPWLIVKGIANQYLDFSSLKIVCHNQTEVTDSPGQNVYKEVTKWTYYSDEIIM